MPAEIEAKSILNRRKGPRDSWFLDSYTVNPYSGCSFNCQFCYIRGSKYGTHMERSLAVKVNAAELLDKQLGTEVRAGRRGYIVLSSASDPYLHFEAEYGITRRLLEVILKHRFPLHLLTRSELVTRDIDVLREIDREAILPDDLKERPGRGLLMSFSFNTLDDEVARVFEPGAPPPSRRLETFARMKEEGFLTGASLMPLLPWISDTSEALEQTFATFARLKADYLLPSTLTLFGNERADSRTLTFRAVEKHYPHLLEKYHKLFGNADYLPAYYQRAFDKKVKEMCVQYGLSNRIG